MNRYERAYKRIRAGVRGEVLRDAPLSKFTTWRVGGEAKIFSIVDTLTELRNALEVAAEEDLPWFTLGRGSNLLFSDEGFEGLVVRLGEDFRKIKVSDNEIRAGAGVALPHLSQQAFKHSLGGLSFIVGIPGSVGGALAINAGAYGSSMSDVVRKVIIFETGGQLRYLDRDEISFWYRGSSIRSQGVVLEAVLSLRAEDSVKLRREMERNFRLRKETQPIGQASAGCVFKNPSKESAGRLLEEVGAKGLSYGGASVSSKHANFIITVEEAAANDVYELMRQLQQRVSEQKGVVLEPEVTLIGRFEGDTLVQPAANQ